MTSMQDFERQQHESVRHHFVSNKVYAELLQGFENCCKASVQYMQSSLPDLISAHLHNDFSVPESLLLPALACERGHICKLFESKFLRFNEHIHQFNESMPSKLEQ